MKYKIYGQTGIFFKGGLINIPDKTGWFGTSTGGWKLSNNQHRVGGPILIGGNIDFADGSDEIITGPMRVLGNINATGNFNNNVVNGHVCIPDSFNVSANFARFVGSNYRHFNGSNGYSSCPDSVPQVKTNLTIPEVVDSLIPPLGERMVFAPNPNNISLQQAPNGSLYIENDTGYIDVPPSEKATEEEREADMYDIHFSSMSFVNDSRLIVRMPSTGRLTRIFIDGDIKVTSNTDIQIVYMADTAKYDKSSHRWTSGGARAIQNDKYTGNLLFYAKKSFNFDALIQGDSLQGTFISRDTIYAKQHMTLAGQLLARYVIIDAEFDGSGFIFVPFYPPKIDPGALARGTYKENDKLVPIEITTRNRFPWIRLFLPR